MIGKVCYNKYSNYLKKIYGCKVYKLPVNLPVSCPNRENGNGCTFCSELGTGFEAISPDIPVREQLIQTKKRIEKYNAVKFIAYFQNYTNTYMPLDIFEKYMIQAAQAEDIVELDVSTRPDCIRADYLECLKKISSAYGVNICIELGLQTANYHTLTSVGRGHGLAEYIDAMLCIRDFGFKTCTHVILNLPGDNLDDCVETAKIISVLETTFVKIHSLYIAKGTQMAKAYLEGDFIPCTKADYFERLRHFLEYLGPDIGVERLFSRIPEKEALFSNWGTGWWKLKDEFEAYMKAENSYQGKCYNYRNGSALRRVSE